MTRFISGITEDTYYNCVDALSNRFIKGVASQPDGLLGVELDDEVIMKVYGSGWVVLDLGGRKVTIERNEYIDIVIK